MLAKTLCYTLVCVLGVSIDFQAYVSGTISFSIPCRYGL